MYAANPSSPDGPELMYHQLKKFINIIDQLRDIGLHNYISLPRIAVLGGQSAGKSSVLESIVGLDILPRSEGLCTRRPLELRLNHVDEGVKPYGIFPDELPGKKFTKMTEIRDNIVGLTEKMCGKSNNIVDKPLVLQVYSHTCPDLTLIDLPGITRIPIEGQPENIEEITRRMCERYMKDYRTIILTVVPANADMTTSDGLQMARRLDPKGVRTIGVITKVDIMDRGVNAKRMILNQEVPLRLGWVAVKNRAQEDIVNQMPVKEAQAKEMAYFASHPIYSSLPPEHFGCYELTKKLSKILFVHIKHSLPEIIKEIKEKQKEADSELQALGPSLPANQAEKMHLLWNMITEFVQTYKNQIGGKYDARRRVNPKGGPQRQELSGGARIKMGFYKLYADLDQMKATQEYTDMVIERAIVMHQGDSIPGFPSVDVFYYLIQPQLEKLRDPALECLNDVYAQLEALCHHIIDRVFMRFPALRPVIMDIIVTILQELREHTKELIESIIDAELNYHFTNDLNFKESKLDPQEKELADAVAQQNPNAQQQQQQQQQQQKIQAPLQGNAFVRDLRLKIDSYYALVVRNVRDTIPKQIGYFLVRKSQDQLQTDLYMRINQNQAIADALGEPKQITERRNTLNALIETLDKSAKMLQRDPDFQQAGMDDSGLSDDIRQDMMARKQQMQSGPPNNMPPNNMPPNQRPPNQGPPGNMPPGNMPPNQRPPNQGPPGNMPPGNQPPGGMPPNQRPPSGMPPPQQRPPGNMPPPGGQRPPSSANPLQK